jgi:hypothetical protein
LQPLSAHQAQGGPATGAPRTYKHDRPRLVAPCAGAALLASAVLALTQEGSGLCWPAIWWRAIVTPLAVLLLPAAVLITATLSATIATQSTLTTAASGSQAPAPWVPRSSATLTTDGIDHDHRGAWMNCSGRR